MNSTPLSDEQIDAIALAVVYEGDATIPHRKGWCEDIGRPFARAILATQAEAPGQPSAVELIYIGDHFYSASGTMMSPIYTKDGHRYDWGFVSRDLRDGLSISIRPATAAERTPYEQQLATIQKEKP